MDTFKQRYGSGDNYEYLADHLHNNAEEDYFVCPMGQTHDICRRQGLDI